MYLLLDIGNTHTHVGLANDRGVIRHADFRTEAWPSGANARAIARWIGRAKLEGAAFCCVVPRATPFARRFLGTRLRLAPLQLTPETITGVGIDFPQPGTIGQDRLANAVAAKHRYGVPCVVVDFGTAVNFDIVDRAGNYIGGVLAPSVTALTDYLHEKTALLPRVTIREVEPYIGRSTEEAMVIGAVHGFRGLIRELLRGIKMEMKARRLPVIATGGYAKLIAGKMPEITAVDPLLTLDGLRINFFLSGPRRHP